MNPEPILSQALPTLSAHQSPITLPYCHEKMGNESEKIFNSTDIVPSTVLHTALLVLQVPSKEFHRLQRAG